MSQTAAPKSALFLMLRVARLAPDGTTPAGTENGYVTDAVVKLDVKPNKRAGKEITKDNGRGDACVAGRRPDTILRYDVTLEVCDDDPELVELLSGGSLIRSGATTTTIGYKPPAALSVAVPNGISLEGWSQALGVDGNPRLDLPYYAYAFPRVLGLTRNDWSLDSDVIGASFDGYLALNTSWGNGPWNDWQGGVVDREWQRYLTTSLPAAQLGYATVPAQV